MKGKTLFSRRLGWIFVALTAFLGVSGLLQMPLARRYYLNDIPGLAWTGDAFVVHKLHYIAAMILIALLSYMVMRWVRDWSAELRLTGSGLMRAVLVLALVLTGAARMYKNLPGVPFGPLETMVLDVAHLGLAGLFGIAALAVRMTGRKSYVVLKNENARK